MPPHLGTLLNPIPNIPVAPALLVYPHVRDCSFGLSRRLTETDGWFYVPEVTLRGSACGSGPWQHRPALTRQCFAYFWRATVVQRPITARALYCCTAWLFPAPLSLHGLVHENVSRI